MPEASLGELSGPESDQTERETRVGGKGGEERVTPDRLQDDNNVADDDDVSPSTASSQSGSSDRRRLLLPTIAPDVISVQKGQLTF